MDAGLRIQVRFRAVDRCEYCGIAQQDEPDLTFHIEHIIARQHGGATVPENLALSCNHCNLHKGPNLAGIDPHTGKMAALFHPRRQRWDEHFVRRGALIIGVTPTGRATIETLAINAAGRVDLRSFLTDRS